MASVRAPAYVVVLAAAGLGGCGSRTDVDVPVASSALEAGAPAGLDCDAPPGTESTLLVAAGVSNLAFDDQNVYGIAEEGVFVVSKCGFPHRWIASVRKPAQPSTGALAVDARAVYWEDSGTLYAADKSTWQVRALGALSGPIVAVQGSLVVHVSPATTGSSGTLLRIPVDGGPPTRLATGLPSWISPMVTDGDRVYFTSSLVDELFAVNVSTGAVTSVASVTYAGPRQVVVTGPSLVFNDGAGDVEVLPTAGGAPRTLIARSTANGDLAADPANVYWGGGGWIEAVPMTGANNSVPLIGTVALELVSDGSSLYWIEDGDVNDTVVRHVMR